MRTDRTWRSGGAWVVLTESFYSQLTFLSCPSGESDRKLALTSSRSDPLELTEVTLRASPLSPPPPWYGLK